MKPSLICLQAVSSPPAPMLRSEVSHVLQLLQNLWSAQHCVPPSSSSDEQAGSDSSALTASSVRKDFKIISAFMIYVSLRRVRLLALKKVAQPPEAWLRRLRKDTKGPSPPLPTAVLRSTSCSPLRSHRSSFAHPAQSLDDRAPTTRRQHRGHEQVVCRTRATPCCSQSRALAKATSAPAARSSHQRVGASHIDEVLSTGYDSLICLRTGSRTLGALV